MTGGKITGNTTAASGGAIFMRKGTFTMTGGKISGNICYDSENTGGGGVYSGPYNNEPGTVNLSDEAVITGNTAGERTDNLHLCTNTVANINASLTGQIGITTETSPVLNKGVTVAKGANNYTITETDLSKLSDDKNTYTFLLGNNRAILSVGDFSWYKATKSTFTLNTAAELRELAQLVNGRVDDFSGKTIELGADIDLNNNEWIPIGTYSEDVYPFHGTFDGKGHTISNMSITKENLYNGLFGSIKNAVIENLSVSGHIETASQDAVQCIGGIVGFAESSTIENCTNHTSILSNGIAIYIGGIAGRTKYTLIENCHNTATIRAKQGNCGLGGIAGELMDNGNSKGIFNCSNSGDITAEGGGSAVGGLAGSVENDTVVNSFNTGKLTGISDSYIGGVVGILMEVSDGREYTAIINCYNLGIISYPKNAIHAGIVVGHIVGEPKFMNTYSIPGDSTKGEFWGNDSEVFRSVPSSQIKALVNATAGTDWILINGSKQPLISALSAFVTSKNEDDSLVEQVGELSTWYHSKLNDGYPCFMEPHTVTYNANGAGSGSVPVDDKDYAVGHTVNVLSNSGNLKKKGYLFKEWNTKADGSGTSYAPESTFVLKSDVTLYAKWSLANFTLNFMTNGGDRLNQLISENGTTIDLASYIPTKKGYKFLGWYSDEQLT